MQKTCVMNINRTRFRVKEMILDTMKVLVNGYQGDGFLSTATRIRVP